MKALILGTLSLFASTFAVVAQEQSEVCKIQWDAVRNAGEDIKQTMNNAKEAADGIRDNADNQYNVCLSGPLRWEEIRWSLDLPENHNG